MSEQETPHDDGHVERRRRGVDPVSLTVGILGLLASAYLLVGDASWLDTDPRWILAGGAVAAGVIMLGVSLRRRRD